MGESYNLREAAEAQENAYLGEPIGLVASGYLAAQDQIATLQGEVERLREHAGNWTDLETHLNSQFATPGDLERYVSRLRKENAALRGSLEEYGEAWSGQSDEKVRSCAESHHADRPWAARELRRRAALSAEGGE